jgi:Ras-related protein Rab-7A
MNNAMQQSAPMSQQSMATSRKKVMLKLVILGNSGVGKTSLMHRYHSNKFTGQYKATIGADFLSKSLSLPANPNSPPQQVTLTIWDTAGQERFQSLGKAFYRGSDACILVYDVTDRSSFDELKKWKEEFDSCLNGGSPGGRSSLMHNRLQHGHPLGRNMSEVKFIVVGNKADKDASGRVVDAKEGAAYANSIGGEFYEGSAKTAMNVEQAFVAAAKAGLEYNNRLQMTTSMMNGAGNAGMPGYVPPQRTVDLKRGNTSGFGDDVCC